MFALRRAAARVAAQPLRQLTVVRPTTGAFVSQQVCVQPAAVLQRSFHQSFIRRAEEGNEEVKEQSTEESAVAASDPFAEPAALATAREALREEENTANIVYVGNLQFAVEAGHIEQEFAQYGTIVNVRVPQDPSGRSKGFAFVEFSNPDEAQRAIAQANQMTLAGRRMLVMPRLQRSDRPARNNGEGRPYGAIHPPSRTLFIGNMSFQMSDKDLSDLFRDIENVLDVRIAIDRRSNQPRGFAHADFVDTESAVRAKAILEKKTIYGRQLRIDFGRAPSERTPLPPKYDQGRSE